MIKTKIFTCESRDTFEEIEMDINNWLESNYDDIKVIETKMTITSVVRPYLSADELSLSSSDGLYYYLNCTILVIYNTTSTELNF
jgi:hypothetical protein